MYLLTFTLNLHFFTNVLIYNYLCVIGDFFNLHKFTQFFLLVNKKWENSGNYFVSLGIDFRAMKINFRVKNENKNPSSLYMRFFDSRNNIRTDIEIKTGFNINPNDWNSKKQVFKPNANRVNNMVIREKLDQLKEDIVYQVNLECIFQIN
ncbi:hypothetical protein CMU66_11705, partial [Elizabethkingia anophelis]|nr:hypothetical protein [Elizabethkingia anophelis]MDV3562874.1 hypothetical protein [Elizabethkingia anophelis]MDV3626285.1 hypothetical protein [Elizabethkingia anophelis]MDV3641222.1 hypothetical protein [Elizabethkingia anophelis]MDV3657488.1 hypothetical protein [Elizabethkingia anophelis]